MFPVSPFCFFLVRTTVNIQIGLLELFLKLIDKVYSFITSCSYSRKTRKFVSALNMGWFASLHKKTSCIATVFLNVAKYSLEITNKKKIRKEFQVHSKLRYYASSSCFIFLNSSAVIEPSPSPSFCNFSLELSKSGLGGGGGIYYRKETLYFRLLNCFNVYCGTISTHNISSIWLIFLKTIM
jgi:hypothetical protein